MAATPAHDSEPRTRLARPAVESPARTRTLPGWAVLALWVMGAGGLGLWHMRPKALHLRRVRSATCAGCRRRHHRLMAVLAVVAGLQTAGVASLVTLGVGAPVCQPPAWFPPDDAAAYVRPDRSASVRLREAVTAGPTGLALLYARAKGADVCRFAANGTLIALMSGGYARGGTMWGHTFLTRPRTGLSYSELRPLKDHEARHINQWAAFTALGGPAAFPLAYAIDEGISPGVHNHFERQAGLAEGGYPDPDGPSPATSRAVIALAAVGLVWFEHRRVRRQVRLLTSLVKHVVARSGDPPHRHTTASLPGRVRRVLVRVAPGIGRLVAEHRRLRRLGCAGCGLMPDVRVETR